MGDKFKRWLAAAKRYWRIWWRISLLAAEAQLLTSWSGVLFLLGKVVRFAFYLVFLFSVMAKVDQLANFTRDQVIFFFLVFNLVDTLTQFLFRGVYHFRYSVVQGNYDLDLLKPLASFFRPIFGWTDVLDALTLVPLTSYLVYFSFSRGLSSGWESYLLFLLVLFNALLVGFSLHLLVCAVCLITLEIDHLVMVYRDLTGLARFPTDIYPGVVRAVLTFVVPVVVLVTVPAKTLMGLLSLGTVLWSCLLGLVFLLLALKFWRYALTKYASASS